MMEEALTALLLNDADIKAKFGARLWWVVAPQDSGSALYGILQVISGPRGYTMKGSDGLHRARVQIDTYAETYLAVKLGMRAILKALDGLKGTFSGVPFQGVFIESERDFSDGDAGGNRLFRLSTDLIIFHTT